MLGLKLGGAKFDSRALGAKSFGLIKIGGSKAQLGSGLFLDVCFHYLYFNMLIENCKF